MKSHDVLHHYICTLQSLTDGLCCTCSCSSHSHHILSSHWHTVIAWGRIWGWLKGVATPPSCATGNVHILSEHRRPSLDTDPVLHMVPTWAWTCLPWVNWVLERDMILKNTANLKLYYMYAHTDIVVIIGMLFSLNQHYKCQTSHWKSTMQTFSYIWL